MNKYFVKLYEKTVADHRIAIRNVGICSRAINKGDKRKIVRLMSQGYDVDLSYAIARLDILNDLLGHYPEFDPGKEIDVYDPCDLGHNCISCVPEHMTFDWLQEQELEQKRRQEQESEQKMSSNAAKKGKQALLIEC